MLVRSIKWYPVVRKEEFYSPMANINIKYDTSSTADSTYLTTEDVAKLLIFILTPLNGGLKAANYLRRKLVKSIVYPEKPLKTG